MSSTLRDASVEQCVPHVKIFDSDAQADRRRAIEICESCPLLDACREKTTAAIGTNIGPTDIVQAAVAWDSDGRPDAVFHPDNPEWVPPAARRTADIDEVIVDRLLESIPVTTTLSPAERSEYIRRAANSGASLNQIRHTLRVHPREADRMVRQLGLRDQFISKPQRPRPRRQARRLASVGRGDQLTLALALPDAG